MYNPNFHKPIQLGYGAYGTVYTYKKIQAVKITLMDSWDKIQSTLREIHALKQLSILRTKYFVSLNNIKYLQKYHKMHIFMNRADGNLKMIDFKDVSAETVQNYCVQMFEGLFAMRKHRLFHRDIKPDNILVNLKESKLYYCDFGLSRQFHDNGVEYGTGYIVTRWYRSPELLKHQKQHKRKANLHYTEKMDVWSIGAIMYEMIFKRPLAAAESIEDALALIDRKVNPLNVKNGKDFSNGRKCIKWDLQTLKSHEKITEKVAKCLIGCLTIDHNKRYGCTRALHALGAISSDTAMQIQEEGTEKTVIYAPLKPSFDDLTLDCWKQRSKHFAELYKRFSTQKSIIAYAIVVFDKLSAKKFSFQHFINSVLYSALVLGSYYNSEICHKLIKYACESYSPYKTKQVCWDSLCEFTSRVYFADSSEWESGEHKSFSSFLKLVLKVPEEEHILTKKRKV